MEDQAQEKKQEQEASGLSRREFLRDAGLAVAGTAAGAALVACGGTPVPAGQAPAAAVPKTAATAVPAQVPGAAAAVEPAFEPEETRYFCFGT